MRKVLLLYSLSSTNQSITREKKKSGPAFREQNTAIKQIKYCVKLILYTFHLAKKMLQII